MTYKVFIAYGGKEGEKVAIDLYAYLEDIRGFKPRCATPKSNSLHRGQSVLDIGYLIKTSDATVWICTKEGITNRKFLIDLSFAISQDIDIPLIPFVANNVKKSELPYPLQAFWFGKKFGKKNYSMLFPKIERDIKKGIRDLKNVCIQKE